MAKVFKVVAAVIIGLGSADPDPDGRLVFRLLPTDGVFEDGTSFEGGRCMDGTPAGYYYGPPLGDPDRSSSLWVLNLLGGGGCGSEQGCLDWNATKGSSDTYNPDKRGIHFLNPDPSENQDFADAHHVDVIYCTGDSHSGQVQELSEENYGLYMDGHLNLKAIIQHLGKTIHDFVNMERFLLTGNSAGGKGVFHNCDWLNGFLNRHLDVLVKCAPRSGWFLPGFAEDEGRDPALWTKQYEYWKTDTTDPNEIELFMSPLVPQKMFLPENCLIENEEWKCMQAQTIYPNTQTPMFAVQNWFDTNKIESQMQVPDEALNTLEGYDYVAYFGRSMLASTGQVHDKPQDGLFLLSCFEHGIGEYSLDGVHWRDAVGDWFNDRVPARASGDTSHIYVDDCVSDPPGVPCNPQCTHLPAIGADGPTLSCEETAAFLLSDEVCEMDDPTPTQCQLCMTDNVDALVEVSCTPSQIHQFCMQFR